MSLSNPPKSPGVYVNEIQSFPISMRMQPSAIPAFVGYTQFATFDGRSLTGIPTLISSMDDFRTFFGGAPDYQFPILAADSSDFDFQIGAGYYRIGAATESLFYLYNCLNWFFLNGGGAAYIVSVGNYRAVGIDPMTKVTANVPVKADRDQLLGGLNVLRTLIFPKPTLIVIPDALTLSLADYSTVQQEMIAQAGELQDRFAILDVHNGDQDLSTSVITDFRNSVGVTSLSYAAAYYPWLKTSVVGSDQITLLNVHFPTSADPATVQNLHDLITPSSTLTALDLLRADYFALVAQLPLSTTLSFSGSVTQYPSWGAAFEAASAGSNTDMLTNQGTVLAAMFQLLFDLGKTGASTANPHLRIQNMELQMEIAQMVAAGGSLCYSMLGLAGYESAFKTGTAITNGVAVWAPGSPVPNPYASGQAHSLDVEFPNVESQYTAAFGILLTAMSNVVDTATVLLSQQNVALTSENSDYSKIMEAISKRVNVLPPAAAMAGIYSSIDNNQGVWMAPANVNVIAAVAPTVAINDNQQASLNVDALDGKSINAIRSFFGSGPAIVWGARTLDGNSQEYRYISVRRMLIMIDQSVEAILSSMIFQPNAQSTWDEVTSAIDGFLTDIWKTGGLAGATPSQAFNVQVGIGSTMTSQDIQNGIMRVSVSVALMQPAEFMNLSFEQQMAVE